MISRKFIWRRLRGARGLRRSFKGKGSTGSWTEDRKKAVVSNVNGPTAPFGMASSCAAAATVRSPPRTLVMRRFNDRKELEQPLGGVLDHAQMSRCRSFCGANNNSTSGNRQHVCTRVPSLLLSVYWSVYHKSIVALASLSSNDRT